MLDLGSLRTTALFPQVRSATHEAMAKIHDALETMPGEGDEVDQPRGLKGTITLFPYQVSSSAFHLETSFLH